MDIPTWFKFKDVDSRDYGIVVINYPPISIPAEKVSAVEIPGRSGSLTLVEGEDVYKNITLSVDCFIENIEKIGEIVGWLRGAGDLILGCNSERRYKARISNQIDFTKAVRGNDTRMFSVIFTADPFLYEVEPESKLLYGPFTYANDSQLASYPLITVYGSGDITLSVGSISVSLTGVSGSVTIDSDARVAYTTPGSNVGITLNDEVWPTLVPGGNHISWTGNVTSVIVQPNWRWLR